jgi:Regulator of ribonuclease activity B
VSLLDRFRQKRPPDSELDLLLVHRLRSRGEDLTQPRPVVHFLDFPSEAAAARAAGTIEEAGYDVEVSRPDGAGAPWTLRAEGMRVVDETTVPAFRGWFERIAGEHGGAYDGWEAPAAR